MCLISGTICSMTLLELPQRFTCVTALLGYTLSSLGIGICGEVLKASYTLLIGTCGVARFSAVG